MIPQKFENIKSILDSIINGGNQSKHINEFVNICSDIALVQYRKSRYKDELFKKEKYDERELSYDLIADIFENKDGNYKQIKKYFNETMKRIESITDEEIIAKIVVLVRSTVNQRISEIRENYGEPFFKIKKAFETFISRNKEGLKEIVFRDIIYISKCAESKIDLDLPQVPESLILNEVFNCKIKTYQIPEVVRTIFSFLNSQEEYCKAIVKTELLNSLTRFYKKRLKDNLKIVEYINYKEEY